MAITYNPTTHTAPTTATASVGGRTVNITGLSPGQVATQLGDGLAPTYVWLSTGTSSDGAPSAMQPFATGTATVT